MEFITLLYSYLLGAADAVKSVLSMEVVTNIGLDTQLLTWILAAVVLLVGLIVGIFGYRMFNFLLRVVFLVVGTLVVGPIIYAMIPVEALQNFVWGGYILGLIIGIILCIFARKLFNLALFIGITIATYFFVAPLLKDFTVEGFTLPEGLELSAVLAIAIGIIASFIFVYGLLPVILMLATSASGSAALVSGVIIAFGDTIKGALGDSNDLVMVIVVAVLTILFFIAQAVAAKKRASDDDDEED